VDKDRTEGKGKQIKGKVREGVGKATGNDEQIAKGKTEQTEGTIQNKFGKVKDEIRKKI
jgi:uncharacterized protein YjbJ (UPF0337 family)